MRAVVLGVGIGRSHRAGPHRQAGTPALSRSVTGRNIPPPLVGAGVRFDPLPEVRHGWLGQPPSDVPAERRFWQASTMRSAMPASPALPQARGSYCFLLPTSPSTFSTPS